MRVFANQAILHLATIYASTVQAFAQLIENERDAGATWLHIVIEENKLIVIGNGHGMVPEMLEVDRQRLTQFAESIAQGNLDADYETSLEKAVPLDSISRYSIEWVMRRIGISGKSSSQRGVKGIGFLAYCQYADRLTLLTRAHLDRMRQAWQDETMTESENPTIVLLPPTRTSISRGDLTYEYDIAGRGESLHDAWGKVMEHGTCVTVSDLDPGEKDQLRPKALASMLTSMFAEDLRIGFKISIFDRISPEAKRSTAKQIEIPVQAPANLGIPLYRGELIWGEYDTEPDSISVELFYDVKGVNLAPQLRFKGSDKFEITTITGLNKEPWNLGKIRGYIVFPSFVGVSDNTIWNAPKTALRPTKYMLDWVKVINDKLTPLVVQAIQDAEERLENASLRATMTDMSSAAMEAISEIPAYNEHDLTTARPSRQTSTKRSTDQSRSPRDPQAISVKVVNEYGQGMVDVNVDLMDIHQVLVSRNTGLSGRVSFTRQQAPHGVSLKVMITPKVQFKKETILEEEFQLREGQPTQQIEFRILTGRPPHESHRLTRLDITPSPLYRRPDRPYEERLHIGRLVVNTLFPTIAESYAAGDEARFEANIAHIVARAVTRFCFSHASEDYREEQEELLFDRLHANYLQKKKNRKRRTSLAKKRV